jgi:hypothetical protein
MTTAMIDGRHVHNPVLSADVYPDEELIQDLTASLRPRLTPTTRTVALDELVRATLEELAPVHVTNYLGVLVERQLRASGNATRTRG